MTTRIKLRRDTAANWESNNPILALGEPGLDTTNNQVKYGDGVTAWNLLAYASSSNADTTQSVFAALTTRSDFTVARSTNGTNWTPYIGFVNTTQQNRQYASYNGWGPNFVDMAIGGGKVVYVDFSPWFGESGPWIADNLETYPVPLPTISLTVSDFTTPAAEWTCAYYLGNTFIITGSCWDDGAMGQPTLPIFAYSTDGVTWTQGAIDYTYVEGIYTTQNGLNNAIYGLKIAGVGYNGTGWLFNLDNLYDGPALGGEGSPGGFYVTSLAATLGSANFDSTPSYQTDAWNGQPIIWTGSRWVIADSAYNWMGAGVSNIWYNTSANPRLGTWIDIPIGPIALDKFGYDWSQEWNVQYNPVTSLATHNIGGIQWVILGLGDGQLLSTSDFSTWYAGIPNPVTYGIAEFFNNGGVSTDISMVWDNIGNSDQRQLYYTGKVTISDVNPASVIPAGTYYIADVDPNTFRLYTDAARTVEVDSSGWGGYTSGDSMITYFRGWQDITALIVENDTIVAGDDNGFIYTTTAGNLTGTFTTVVDGFDYTVQRLVYGAITQPGTSWERTNTVTGDVNTVTLSEYEFRATAQDNNTSAGIKVNASGWELYTRVPQNIGRPNQLLTDAFSSIYSEDWYGEGDGPKLDIAIDLPDSYHLFGRYGDVRLGGPIIHDRLYNYNNPPVDATVNSGNYQTAAQLVRNLWNNDINQTNSAFGWAGLVQIDSDTYNGTSTHHYYLPPGDSNGQEITFIGRGTNLANIFIWVQSGTAGIHSWTNSYWLPFVVWNSGGYSTRSIAKAIWYNGSWYFDNDAWAD